MRPINDGTQPVILRGGRFNGTLALAPLPPGALSLTVWNGDQSWTETYVYFEGRYEKGGVPVMIAARPTEDKIVGD